MPESSAKIRIAYSFGRAMLRWNYSEVMGSDIWRICEGREVEKRERKTGGK